MFQCLPGLYIAVFDKYGEETKYDSLTPYDKIHHYTPNISEYLYFKWYDWVWYIDEIDPSKKVLGRWLGPAQSIGQGNAHHVLSSKAKVKTRSSYQRR